MLKPLAEWMCDACGEIIEGPEHGYIEWQNTENKMHGFRIVHHALHSPRRDQGRNCYYRAELRGGDRELLSVVGALGVVVLTSWLDVGSWHDDPYSGSRVRDLREWVTLFRRLHLPYFEEARRCDERLHDLMDDGVNEIYLYLPDTLRRVIEKHESSS